MDAYIHASASCNCLRFHLPCLKSANSLILAQRQQDYPITKAIYELYQLLGDGRLIASALSVWAMCLLGTTMVGASFILGKKAGSDLPRLRPFARARYRLQDQ